MKHCYLCPCTQELRICTSCEHAVCRACACHWPLWPLAVMLRTATCRLCTLATARREVAAIRTWLSEQGIEPDF
jgi:hypothetical protein